MKYTVLFTREERFKVEVETGSESIAAGTARELLKANPARYKVAQTSFVQVYIGHDLTISELVDWEGVGKLPRRPAAKSGD